MASHDLIDAQFDRAVEIVQSLPKTGPIQTDYEEKLTMYSLYKQATVGNVQSPRPSVWDMLGRAKWDAWTKHRDLDSREAKWLYVDALLKVLRKYSDKTVAMDLVRELESYGDPSDLVMSGSLSRSRASSSSGSTASDEDPLQQQATHIPAHLRNDMSFQQSNPRPQASHNGDETSEDESDGEVAAVPPPPAFYAPSQLNRPQSSLSSRRYRTPMAGSLLMSPSVPLNVPATQPQPAFQTPSAFAESSPSIPSSAYPTTTVSYPGAPSHSSQSRSDIISPPVPVYPTQPVYRGPLPPQYPQRPFSLQSGMTPRPSTRLSLERAIENVQAHMAALAERLETLEAASHRSTSLSMQGTRSPIWASGDRSGPFGGRGDRHTWDIDDMGMWTLVLHPLARVLSVFRRLAEFLAHNQNRSPTLVVVRRLFLDISFLLCCLALMKAVWRRSGVRRREVIAALKMVWRAVLGHKQPRLMVDRAV